MVTLTDFLNSLNNPLIARAFTAAILIGIICSVIGVFIILKGVIFLGEAIAHAAFAGASLAILLGMSNPILLIMIFGVSTSILVTYVNEKEIMGDEVVIGISFTFFMALAIFFIGLMDRLSTTVSTILLGRILFITLLNYQLLLISTIVVILSIILLKRNLYTLIFDEEVAKASGINVKALNYYFFILVALAINVSLTSIGAILVFAMLITPAASAYQWTYNINKMLIISLIFGIASSVGGFVLSFIYNWPSGSTIIILSTLFFLISFLLSPKRTYSSKSSVDFDLKRLPHFHSNQSITSDQYIDHLRETTEFENNDLIKLGDKNE
ncbi:MAG: metal ABC transporter permease [Candidatus Heimdallarchaeota archaeon]|nr:metal ABC transporter permease [Candidatus Heimdallarchaeota archaeon]MDH5646481.1 metal ABC transporter permease [Candidatus Heimdallarchaeota archaeon]